MDGPKDADLSMRYVTLCILEGHNEAKALHFRGFFDRSTCSKRSKESLFSAKKMSCSIYSILVYFIMFSFQVLTCLRIVSIRIILNLNKFRQVGTCSDMFENHNNSYHIESEQVQTCFNMFRHV